MKSILVLLFIMIGASSLSVAQSSPPSSLTGDFPADINSLTTFGDTLTFTPFPSETPITNQYLNQGVIFSGFNGSTAPVVFDYSTIGFPYGKILHSDNWHNALRMNFVDTSNEFQYHLASKVEFDNAVDSAFLHSGEVDYMSIDVFNSSDVLIYHYLSTSPEHVVINLGIPSIAYITIDEADSTSFILDNILVDFGNSTAISEVKSGDIIIYPNPFSGQLAIQFPCDEETEIMIFDIHSRKILQQSFINSTTINTEGMASGLYIYELRNNKGIIANGKIIKP